MEIISPSEVVPLQLQILAEFTMVTYWLVSVTSLVTNPIHLSLAQTCNIIKWHFLFIFPACERLSAHLGFVILKNLKPFDIYMANLW